MNKIMSGKDLKHVAIIMDGNGRWAQQKGLPRTHGHKEAARRIPELLKHVFGASGISYLTLYAFSTENWNRPKWEVNTLFAIARHFIRQNEQTLLQQRIRFLTIGDLTKLPEKLRNQLEGLKAKTAHFEQKTLVIAINYGARDEIVRAVQKVLNQNATAPFSKQNLTWEDLKGQLDTAGMPDPDLIIRTSGEQRLSNFLLLQAAYSEFYFTDILFPDFSPSVFDQAIESFQKRTRRLGGLKS